MAAVLTALVAAAPAQAAFPGKNGRLAFGGAATESPAPSNISTWIQPPAASQQIALDASEPAWSPCCGTEWIAFTSFRDGNYEIYRMSDTGGALSRLTTDPAADGSPTWSPVGRIAFSSTRDGNAEIYVMNGDGTNQTRLTNDPTQDGAPSWSPDGTKIAFWCGSSICVMNSDGTGRTTLGSGRNPDWSPDGRQIAFDDDVTYPNPDPENYLCSESQSEIFKMNADGSDRTQMTFGSCMADYPNDSSPAWSPDGTTIAFAESWESIFTSPDLPTRVMLMPAAGGGYGELGGGPANQFAPAWEQVFPGYSRPKAATPLYASLVPAYRGCQSFNRQHAGPLAVESCSPPPLASSTLTVGTPDANSNPAAFTGSARYTRDVAGALTEDLAIDVSLSDVRCAVTSAACPEGPTSDYAGRLLLISPPLQITDRDPPGPVGMTAATGLTNFPVPFDCTPTPSTSTGSTCSISTTANTLLPGAVRQGARSVWEFGPVHVRDAGPNGTGFGGGCPPTCGDGDETLFLRQGIFVP
jgi:TolB protein